jgi:asparagine synthase (glutamine-hydrolysing)
MCGLAGILGPGAAGQDTLVAMARSIAHRGPDDEGVWIDAGTGIGLAHRRLAIVDLSPMGHQPMASASGRLVLAFNGEIYNHRLIRAELEALRPIAWRGHSDTETLVEAIGEWGLTAALGRAVGMFALAVWDRQERTLQLARDRFGEKPLYFGWVGEDFVFASELKALRQHPRFAAAIDRRALRLLASRAYIPAPFSIYEQLFKLEPGCILTATAEAARHPTLRPPQAGDRLPGLSIDRFWSLKDATIKGLANPVATEAEALDGLEQVVGQAIDGQAVADVSVGAFLSGGIDSSAVVALYQAHSPGRVKTFTIGFEQAGYDEAVHAKAVAAHFGTEHHERYVSVADAQAVIPSLGTMYDEPFADSSQIPTHLVSRLARDHVTVALSGDGGDELFGGYSRYLAMASTWAALQRMPRGVRKLVGGALGAVPPRLINRGAAVLGMNRAEHFGHRVHKAFGTMRGARDLGDLVGNFLDEWDTSPVLPSQPLPAEGAFDLLLDVDAPDITRMMYNDATSYLPDDILCKVDRAAMAVSLETRVPFLDHRVAEFAARIPVSMQIRGGTGKTILRRLLYRHAPEAMFDRPKAGFAVPVGEWIRGPLRAWAEELLDTATLASEGYWDPGMVERRWQAHLAGTRDSTQALWTVLMFQAWKRDQAQR